MLVFLHKLFSGTCTLISTGRRRWFQQRLLLIVAVFGFIYSNAQNKFQSPQPAAKFLSSRKAGEQSDLFATQNSFIENKGQYGKAPASLNSMGKIVFGYEGFSMPVLFTEKGMIYLQKKAEVLSEREREKLEKKEQENEEEKEEKETHFITMRFVNANAGAQIISSEETSSYFTYSMLQERAKGFKKITYKNIYPGIDISFYSTGNGKPGFEYSIRLQPGADLSLVKMEFGGDVKMLQQQGNGAMRMKSEFGVFEHSMPVGFYENDPSKKIACTFRKEKNVVGFATKEKYDTTKTLVIDPFVSSTSNLTGLNAGKAKDIDFDYAGNTYVTGGGDGATNHMLAKYDANGVLQWTFSGVLTNPSWQFGTYFGGWVVEKTTGSVYLGQGFEYINGFSIIRINTAGLYDNYITAANPSFREDWKMYWNCNNGSPQILIAGGGTNSNINFGICTPPSTTISSLNITGIPYSGSTGWAQDISDLIIDPLNNDLYTIYGSLYGTPSLSNQIYKNKAPYSAASLAWNLYSGFVSIQEIANRPYLAGTQIDNSSNVFAVNSSYLFYWDGKNLKAFDKATGNTVGTPLTIATNSNLMSGGIIADECNNIYVGSTNGTIKVYKFNGSIFNDAPAADISIPGYSSKSVYDLAYNESQKLLYVSGDGFVAAFDVSSYGCPSTTYTINVNANCGTGTATVTISPTPPSGSTITYVLYDGSTQLASNSTGVFTGLSPGITYTVKVYINQICSGSLTVKDFVLPGPAVSLSKTDATCGNATGSVTATGSGGTSPYLYSKDGVNFQGGGTFINLAAGLYIITVKDAGGCKTIDSIIVKNSNGPSLTYTKTDILCGSNNGTITASGLGGTAPLQYSINGTNYQTSNFFPGLSAGNYTLTVKDAAGCSNAASVTISSSNAPQLTVTPAATTCNNSNGTITVFGSGGAAPLQYSINGNIFQPGNIFSNLSGGNYTVSVKDANGCITTANTTVANSPGPTVTALATTASCNNVNGSITATGTGTAPLMYSINGSFFQTSNIFTGLAAGTYTVTVKDANGCINTTSVAVNNTSGPVVTATAGNASCGISNGSITITATGSTPFQYSINGFTYQLSNIFSGLGAGNYVVYAKDAFGCIGATTVTVKNTAAPQITAVATPTSCTVNDGKITATGTGGTGALQYSIDGSTYQGSGIFPGLAEGIYTVIVKDANGCTQSTTVTITNSSGLTLTASSISTTCTGNNGSITAVATGGKAPLQYSINGVSFQSSNTFSNLASGNYIVTVKDANSCSISATATVGSVSAAVISATKTDANCNNNNGVINATATGGTTPYLFSIDGINFQTSGQFINLAPATYTVTVKDATGCTNTISVTIVNNGAGPGPKLVVKTVDPSFCGNNEGKIQVAGSGGAGSYTFSINGLPFQGGGTFSPLPPGDYTVTVMDKNGCTDSRVINVPEVAAPTLTATTTATACGTNNGSITATGAGGTKPYRYNINGGPLQTSGTFPGLSTGTYIIGIRDAEGCSNSITVIVTNTGGPTVSATKKDGTCGINNASINATGSGGTGPYSYSLDGINYQSSGLFTGLSAGTYTVTVKDATGCTGGTGLTINNPGGPVLSLITNATTCNSNNGTITANASGGSLPLSYSIDGTIFKSNNSFNNLPAGSYTITVLDAAGCFSKANTTIIKTALPEVSAFTVPSLCNSNSGSITATGVKGSSPYTYSIDGNIFQSSNNFNNLSAGFYTVTIKDASGCTNTTGVSVSSASGPQLSSTAVAATCGNLNGSIVATGSGGLAPLNYSIDGINYQSGNSFGSLGQGTYIISVKDANGCINSKPVAVGNINGPQQITTKSVNTTCGGSNGSVTATVTGGTPAFQYSINGTIFQPGNLFSNLASGNYNLTVKDANNCSQTVPVKILDLAGPSVTASSLAAGCLAPDGIITATSNGGTAPLQYSIDGTSFQSSNIFTGLAGGNYSVTVKDLNGCKNTIATTVNTASGPVVTANSSTASCGASNGSITVNASGGTAPFLYSIDGINFLNNNSFNTLPAGSYTVSVKDANGCVNSTTAIVNNTAAPSITASSSTATCNASNGSITATATGGTAPFLYSIDGINYLNNNSFNSLAAGSYTVSVKDANGCINSTTAIVNNTAAPNITASSSTATCNASNGSITATATGGTAPFLYSIDGINFSNSNSFNSLPAGSYTVSVKDANGCINSTTTIVNNTAAPNITASSSTATCNASNGSITATATGGTAPFLYSIDGINFLSNNIFNNIAAGAYTVSVKDANGCINSTTAIVNNTAAPNITASSSTATCNASNGSITATATGGTAPFLYSIDGINFSNSNSFNSLPAGSYTVSVKDANGCINSTTAVVNNTAAPTITASSSTATCNASNGSITATATGGTAPFLYSIDGINFLNNNSFNSLPAGSYTVSVKDANGCINSTTAIVNNTAAPNITASSSTATCNASNGSITATATGGTAPFLYSIDGINFLNSNSFNSLHAGAYTVSVKDANGCINSTTAIVNNTAAPTITASSSTATCNASNGSITATATGGTAPFLYSIDGINFLNNNSFNSLPAGSYTVSVKDANGCINSTTAIVNNTAAPNITANSSTATCNASNASNGSITATATGGTAPFLFSIDGINFSNSSSFNSLPAGAYTVSVKDANGCVNSTTAIVNNTAAPTITASSSTATCNASNGSITATATGGTAPFLYSIDGINFLNNNSFNSLAAGSYTVSVKDANGCINSTTAIVNNTAAPNITASSSTATCNASNGSITATATGGTAPFLYSIDGINFLNSNSFNSLPAGSYTVSVKDANGCINSTTAVVNNTAAPTITASSSTATCNASNGSIIATATGGTAPFLYSIDGINFQNNNVFNNLPAGSYAITVKDANGCSSVTGITINNSSGPTLNATATAATCGGNNGSITAISFGGVPPFLYSIDGINFQQSNTFTAVAGGSYTVFVRDANGCINSTTITVASSSGPTINANSTASSCNTNSGSITATATGTAAPFTYSIDAVNFQSTGIFSGLAAGTYTVTVKDANGCTAVSNITVTSVNAVAVNAGNDITLCEGTGLPINASSDGTSFSWSPADGLSNPSLLNPVAAPKTSTTYVLTAFNGACVKTDTLNVIVNPAPIANAGSDTSVCTGNSLQLHAGNASAYTWSPPVFLSDPAIANPVIVNLPGDMTYYLSVTDNNGCHSLFNDTIHIKLLPPAKVFAGKDTSIALGQPLQLNAIDLNGTGFTTYSWSPPYRLSNPFLKDPVATPDKEIVYTVTASNTANCRSTDNITIRVYAGPDIYVPTAFTPNNDGLNDVERVTAVGIKEFKFFNIYNRFGELVFTTTDPSKGWDGYYKGSKQPPAAYVWQTEGVGFDGKVIYKKGTVVLIR